MTLDGMATTPTVVALLLEEDLHITLVDKVATVDLVAVVAPLMEEDPHTTLEDPVDLVVVVAVAPPEEMEEATFHTEMTVWLAVGHRDPEDGDSSRNQMRMPTLLTRTPHTGPPGLKALGALLLHTD